MDLQCVGSSSSLSSSGISFSPTMLSITLSRGPPPVAPPLFLLRLLGAETTASSAERCFLNTDQYLRHTLHWLELLLGRVYDSAVQWWEDKDPGLMLLLYGILPV